MNRSGARAVLELVRKELAQFRRDRLMMVIILVSPVMQLTILGLAANFDLQEMPLVVFDRDGSEESRALTERFFLGDEFRRAPVPVHEGELERMVDRGDASAVAVVPERFSADLARGTMPELQFVVDGSEAIAAGLAARVASRIVADFTADYLGQAGTRTETVTADISVLYNPTLESRKFFVPGILALVLMVITMLLTSIAIVKEKENGTLEQLIVSPLRPRQIILGKLLPFAGVGFLDMLLVLGVAVFGFGVVPAGSVALLLVLSLLFILTTLGLGLFISTVSATQQQAMMTAMFFVMMPMMFLSGFVFPIENMPEVVQWLTYLLPLRYYFTIIRGIFLRGVGMEVLWPQALGLFVFGITFLAISAARFRKRLD